MFFDFWPKNGQNGRLQHLLSAKRGRKVHFETKRLIRKVTAANLDIFHILFHSLTPKTKEFREGQNSNICDILADFAAMYSSQKSKGTVRKRLSHHIHSIWIPF